MNKGTINNNRKSKWGKIVLNHLSKQSLVLENLLTPLDVESFFKKYWGKKPVLIRGKQPGAFKNIFSVEKLTSKLEESAYPFQKLKFFRKPAFLHNPTRFMKKDTNRNPILDYLKLTHFIKKERGSLVVDAIQRFEPSVCALTNQLSEDLLALTSCSAYYTGPHGRTFRAHWDVYDVFILQIDGTKKWNVYKPVIRNPLPDFHQPIFYEFEKGKPMMTETIREGDLLYIPRGFPHEVHSTTRASLHLTINMSPPTWYDWLKLIVEEALKVTAADPLMRETCPELLTGEEGQVLLSCCYSEIWKSLVSYMKRIDSRDYMENRYACRHEVSGARRQICTGNLNKNTVVSRLPGINFLKKNGKTVTLKFDGKAISLPRSFEKALSFMQSSVSFRVADIPDYLSEKNKISIVRDLMRANFLSLNP